PKSDTLVMVITFALTVVFDLVIAIEVGMILAAALFIKRMSKETNVTVWKDNESTNDTESIELRTVPEHVQVYDISGPLFFGAADKLLEIKPHTTARCLILRMRAVPALDATAMNTLEEILKNCKKQNICLILSHVNEQPLSVMKKSGFYEAVGADYFCAHIDEALSLAKTI
ncbi:MAG: STAS domain-containing protein, partial [Clostridia bacterium]|nr:STAS domain-containing protein [Clostridia bacterium]